MIKNDYLDDSSKPFSSNITQVLGSFNRKMNDKRQHSNVDLEMINIEEATSKFRTDKSSSYENSPLTIKKKRVILLKKFFSKILELCGLFIGFQVNSIVF